MKAKQTRKTKGVVTQATDSAPKVDWLRVVIMVENTEANRAMSHVLSEEARRLANRFQGDKIVKCEALQVFATSVTSSTDEQTVAHSSVQQAKRSPA